MDEEWVQIPEFPDYLISNYGQVTKLDGQRMTKTPVQYNVATVGLRLPGDPKTHRRSVSRLVAEAFLPDPPREDFNTPIHLDGDRSNTRADNLMWRPLWFAVMYHKEAKNTRFPNWRAPIKLVETGETFKDIHELKRTYGLLEMAIHNNLIDPGEYVFPTGHHFVYA